MIKVSVNLERGEYTVASEDNSQLIIKLMSGSYDKETMERKRKEIEKPRKWVPTDKLNLVDTGIYDAICDFDKEYGTEYAEKYVNTTIKEISYTGVSEKKSDYQKRTTQIKAKEFEDAGISVEYELNFWKAFKNLKLKEIIQVFKLAFAQKQNGVKVSFPKKEKLLLEPAKEEEPEEDVPEMPDEETLAKMREEDAQEEKVEELEKEPEIKSEPEKEEDLEEKRPEIVIPPIVPILSEEAKEVEPEQTNEPKTIPQKPKKAISRSKSIQASKKAYRESQKMKNLYKNKGKPTVAKPKEKKVNNVQKTGITKRKRSPQPISEPPKQEATTDVLSKQDSKMQGESFLTRFTRKIKDKADSIHNKKYIPSLTTKQKKIAGAVGAFALVAAIGIGGYAAINHYAGQENTKGSETKTPEAVETVTPESPSSNIEENFEGINGEIEKPNEEHPVEQTPEVKPEITEEEQRQKEEEARKQYQSSIKVGANLNIESGKFFETPEGQGNFGRFESFKDGVKEINMIDIMTETSYIAIKDSNVNLYELKQQYPDAKFSYHIVCRNADGTTTVLGWLTEDSLEQNKEKEQDIEQQGDLTIEIEDDTER